MPSDAPAPDHSTRPAGEAPANRAATLSGSHSGPLARDPAAPRAAILFEPDPVTTHVVFASPHSGRVYPADMTRRSGLEERLLRSSEDAYIDELIDSAPGCGAPLLITEVPRAYVDFNRAETELDPALTPDLPRGASNPRIASGLGVIPRVVAQGRAIYRAPLPLDEVRRRIECYWHPYHQTLAALLERQRSRFGRALLVDMHSMPHEALNGHVGRGHRRPDIVLGDRHGAACRPEISEAVAAIFEARGFKVARNVPFAGVYVVQRHGRPAQGIEAIQIEIDRGLYLDENRIQRAPCFADFRALMAGIVADIAALGQHEQSDHRPGRPLAAE